MPKNLDDLGLKSVANSYDVFFIDIWGVLHNGISLYQNSVNVSITFRVINQIGETTIDVLLEKVR